MTKGISGANLCGDLQHWSQCCKPAVHVISSIFQQDFIDCHTHTKGEMCLCTPWRPFSGPVPHTYDFTSCGYLFQVFFCASAMLITQTHVELGFAVASICCQFEAGISYLVVACSHTFNPCEENNVKTEEKKKDRMQPQTQQPPPELRGHPWPTLSGPVHS